MAKGKVLGLIGESGAGKSTIGLSAMAYGRGGVRLTGGEIILNGRNIRLADPAALCSGDFLRLWPHLHGTDGFFAAVWQRT